MMDPGQIRANSRKAARESARNGVMPYIVWPEDLARWKAMLAGTAPAEQFPFPLLGDRNPRGYKLVRELFIDMSGMGGEDEPAVTIRRLISEELQVGKAYGFGDIGQFQGYLKEYEPTDGAREIATAKRGEGASRD